jgi:GABA(A) receptor-associated protein
MSNIQLGSGELITLRQKYPDRIPIFVTKASNARDIPDIPKHKFLAPTSLSISQFIYIIRRQIQLPPEKALFVFINNTLPPSNTTLAEMYSVHKSPDGALRMVYTSENTFGI